MDGSPRPEQPTPSPSPDQLRPPFAQEIKNEPASAATPSNLGSNIENKTVPTVQVATPTFNAYREVQSPSPAVLPELGQRTGIGVEAVKEDLAAIETPNTLEEGLKVVEAATALAKALDAGGDKSEAEKVMNALLGGKLTELDTAPTMAQLQKFADKAQWDGMSTIQKVAVVIGSK